MSYEAGRTCSQCGMDSPYAVICGECEIAERYEKQLDEVIKERDEARRTIDLVHYLVAGKSDKLVSALTVERAIGQRSWTEEGDMAVKKTKKVASTTVKDSIKEQQRTHIDKQLQLQREELEDALKRKFFIEDFIRECYYHKGICLFWSDRLSTDEDLGSLEEVETALLGLIVEGRLKKVFCIHGPEGHLCWQHDQEHFNELCLKEHLFKCEECGFEVDDLGSGDPGVRISQECGNLTYHYQISDAWKIVLHKRRVEG